MAEMKEAGMLERLCQAAIAADDQDGWTITPRDAENIVRAVLKVLREPTQGMVDAGRWPAEDEGPAACWKAMLDAAFSQEVHHD